MANLEHLKIKNAPKAFEEFAEKINSLVELLEGMEGALGVDVQVAHSPRVKVPVGGKSGTKKQPRGKILVSGLVQQMSQQVDAQGAGGSGGGTASKAVGANGLLIDVVLSSSANAAGYPTQLIVGDTGSEYTQIDPRTLTIIGASNSIQFDAGISSSFARFNGVPVTINSADFVVDAGAATLEITQTNITHSMSIKTIDVCVNGNAMQMLVLASEPF